MGNPHGCKDCKEYGRLLDQAKAMRIEDGKGYRLDMDELRQENEALKRKHALAIEASELAVITFTEQHNENEQLKAERDRLRELLSKEHEEFCACDDCEALNHNANGE